MLGHLRLCSPPQFGDSREEWVQELEGEEEAAYQQMKRTQMRMGQKKTEVEPGKGDHRRLRTRKKASPETLTDRPDLAAWPWGGRC